MLLFVVFLVLLLSEKSDNQPDISYSFDTNFFDRFDGKMCNGTSEWQIVKYNTLNIASPYTDRDNGFKALRQSCASSFPIDFFGGTLEITIFIRASSQTSGLTVEIFDEQDSSISRFVFGQSSEALELGWRTLLLQITNYTKGYIQLLGRSLKFETVVIDSIRYKPNMSNTRNLTKVKRTVNYKAKKQNNTDIKTNELESEKNHDSSKRMPENSAKEKQFEGFPEDENEKSVAGGLNGILDYRTEPPSEPNKEPQQTIFWMPIVYFMATLAITALITGVSAYFCGKMRTPHPSPIFVDDSEPPRTVIIPRVTGTNIHNNSRFSTFS